MIIRFPCFGPLWIILDANQSSQATNQLTKHGKQCQSVDASGKAVWNSRCSIWGPWKEHGLGKKRWGIGIYHVCSKSSALSNISTMSQWELFGDCPTFIQTVVFHFSTSFCRWLCRNRNCGNCWNCTYWNFMDKELSYLVYNWSWHVFPRQLGWRSPGRVPLGIQRWLSQPSYQNSTAPQLSAAFRLSPDFGWCLTAANRWKIKFAPVAISGSGLTRRLICPAQQKPMKWEQSPDRLALDQQLELMMNNVLSSSTYSTISSLASAPASSLAVHTAGRGNWKKWTYQSTTMYRIVEGGCDKSIKAVV